MATKLIWNGCDSYTEFENALHDPDLKKMIVGDILYTKTNSYEAFLAIEIPRITIPVIEGELNYDNLIVTDSGHVYLPRIL